MRHVLLDGLRLRAGCSGRIRGIVEDGARSKEPDIRKPARRRSRCIRQRRRGILSQQLVPARWQALARCCSWCPATRCALLYSPPQLISCQRGRVGKVIDHPWLPRRGSELLCKHVCETLTIGGDDARLLVASSLEELVETVEARVGCTGTVRGGCDGGRSVAVVGVAEHRLLLTTRSGRQSQRVSRRRSWGL